MALLGDLCVNLRDFLCDVLFLLFSFFLTARFAQDARHTKFIFFCFAGYSRQTKNIRLFVD